MNAVAAPLALLADLRLVRRHDDPLRARRPTWTLADPLLRLWAVVLRRRRPALEADRAAAVWSARNVSARPGRWVAGGRARTTSRSIWSGSTTHGVRGG
ncbi:MAG: hypothetical protein H0V93_16430 [Euzebyales bacterium]|nr:hypothetical protein [Euzebyales bacterium]